MKKLAVVLLLVAVMAGMASAEGYEMGKTTIGPLIGFSWHDLMIGAQGEYGFNKNISGGGIIGWSSQSEDYYYATWSYTYISIGAQGNYHFKPGQRLDPFVGAVLGYDIVSSSVEYAAGYGDWYTYNYSASASAMFFGANAGINYDLTPTVIGNARVGYPYYLAAGVSFKF